MRMLPTGFTALVAFTLVVTGTNTTFAQAACEPFEIFSELNDRYVEYIDSGAEGAGAGDIRIGYMPLSDASGMPIGHHRWFLSVLDSELADSSVRTSQRLVSEVLVFEEGEIFLIAIPSAGGAPQDTSQPSVRSFEGAIIGGTGAFAFARGTFKRNFEENTASFDLNIRCD